MTPKVLVQISISLFLFFGKTACSERPHIIFMLIDDLGWNDVSFHGSLQIPTPNIDTLAYSGVILNNYYVQPICTPSRGSLLTGKYPIKLGLQHYVIASDEPWGLSPKEILLPEYLKHLGYSTHGIGKWHLGFYEEDYLPTNRGFDTYLGYWTGKKDFFTHFEENDAECGLDLHDGVENAWNFVGYYSTELFTDRAKRIIQNHNSSEPLFLYIAHQAVHAGNFYSPLQAPEHYVRKFSHIKDEPRRTFAGIVSALDVSVGEIISALDKAGILKNSIVVFSTDNGAAVEGIDESTGSSWPLRGSKYNMWEGGVRGTAFVWSPLLKHSQRHVAENLMHITDWLPTLYSAAGGDPAKLGEIDGYNQWPSISTQLPSPRTEILLNIDSDWKVEAIRKGRYKLLKGSVFNGNFDGWFDKEGKKKESIPFPEDNLKLQQEVYKKFLEDSKVIHILSKRYEKFLHFNVGASNIDESCKSEDCSSIYDYIYEYIYSSMCKKPNNEENTLSFAPIQVICGPKPQNASTNCQPLKEHCLFDIENDPCEYNNLASVLTPIVQELEELLDKYRAQAVLIRNRPADPASNPKYHGYAWTAWQGKKFEVND